MCISGNHGRKESANDAPGISKEGWSFRLLATEPLHSKESCYMSLLRAGGLLEPSVVSVVAFEAVPVNAGVVALPAVEAGLGAIVINNAGQRVIGKKHMSYLVCLLIT